MSYRAECQPTKVSNVKENGAHPNKNASNDKWHDT